MATKIYISGNFLIAEDPISREPYFKVKVSGVHHLRDGDDNFSFFQDGLVNNVDGQPQALAFGIQKSWSWDTQELTQSGRTGFQFTDIVDGAGLPYADADTLDQYLNENLGAVCGSALTAVATDATLTGDGTFGNPLSVVPSSDFYEERWDSLTSLVGGAWHTINTGASPNSLISIVIDSNINNNTCGIRAVGSGLNRTLVIDKDSTSYWIVKTDASGDIQIFTTNTNVLVRVESYHK